MKTSSKLTRKRKNGFLSRMKTNKGRAIIKSRRKKKRDKLTKI
uniref:Ribosomal protein L34 n=1 Tax=Polysiphonia infestans TaxID=2006978 RepID=A0A1Z1ME75_9FLOR|nr:ribosomal protein L34 [Polysiphonia infestans]ARW64266.1 ribosomal protein L34 [Polysiphonia infestans]